MYMGLLAIFNYGEIRVQVRGQFEFRSVGIGLIRHHISYTWASYNQLLIVTYQEFIQPASFRKKRY